jgi:hypothetical protein
MPRIAFDGAAFQTFPYRSDVPGKYDFDSDNRQEYPQRIRLRQWMRFLDSPDALDSYEASRYDKGKTDNDGRNRLRLERSHTPALLPARILRAWGPTGILVYTAVRELSASSQTGSTPSIRYWKRLFSGVAREMQSKRSSTWCVPGGKIRSRPAGRLVRPMVTSFTKTRGLAVSKDKSCRSSTARPCTVATQSLPSGRGPCWERHCCIVSRSCHRLCQTRRNREGSPGRPGFV